MKYLSFIFFFSCILCQAFSSKAQTITTFAGSGSVGQLNGSYGGDGGQATSALLNNPSFIVFDKTGNLYISDQFNNRIRKIDTAGIISTFAGTGTLGFSGDGGLAVSAKIFTPRGLAFDAVGNLIFCDGGNNRIRKIDTNGYISTIAGSGQQGFYGDGGPALNAKFNNANEICLDTKGNIYIVDFTNNRIRVIDTSGNINTFAGTGSSAYSGDSGFATSAGLSLGSIIFDKSGNLILSDFSNQRIRKIGTNGIITTIAGTGSIGFSGDAGPALSATLSFPSGMTFDAFGNFIFCDERNQRIRKIDTNGIISTIAGNGINGFSGDSSSALLAEFDNPVSIRFNKKGDLLCSDLFNNRIRKISFSITSNVNVM